MAAATRNIDSGWRWKNGQ
jgi:hypothetical protein